jgi:hypothetical protein
LTPVCAGRKASVLMGIARAKRGYQAQHTTPPGASRGFVSGSSGSRTNAGGRPSWLRSRVCAIQPREGYSTRSYHRLQHFTATAQRTAQGASRADITGGIT